MSFSEATMELLRKLKVSMDPESFLKYNAVTFFDLGVTYPEILLMRRMLLGYFSEKSLNLKGWGKGGIDQLDPDLEFKSAKVKTRKLPRNGSKKVEKPGGKVISTGEVSHSLTVKLQTPANDRGKVGDKSLKRQIAGAEIEEGVWHRFIHRATNGKHYKKPRGKGLF